MEDENGFIGLDWFKESAEKKREKEEGIKEMINWGKLFDICSCDNFVCDVIPVVVQEFGTREVLMLAYANWQAVGQTLKTGRATFWSNSRKKLWIKGETSSNYLTVKEILVNCEQNSLLYLVELSKSGGACHVKNEAGNYRGSCFYRRVVCRGNEEFLLEFV